MKSLVMALVLSLAVSVLPAQTTQAPNMVKIGVEGITIKTAPIGTILQFGIGTGNTWETPFAVTSTTLPLFADYTVLGDPDNGVVKEIDAQQIATSYVVAYTAAGSSTVQTVTIPALPVIVPPPVAGVCASAPTLNYATDGTIDIHIPPNCTITSGTYSSINIGSYFLLLMGNPSLPPFQPGMGTNQQVGQGAAYMTILPNPNYVPPGNYTAFLSKP